ncbi:MAG: class I adenylate-forming enzyme family protein [Novosphingobium sp.]
MTNRAEALLARADETPASPALIIGDTIITYRMLAARVRTAAGGLEALGVAQGDHVGIWLPSTPDFIVIQQALFLLGAVVTPINVLYRPGEITHAVQCCALTRVITSAELAATVDKQPPCPLIVIDTAIESEDTRSLSCAIADSGSFNSMARVKDEDLALLLLTSATTGKAKGVMLTASNLTANYDRTPAWLGLDRHSVILCALPLYNTFGLNQGINAMLATGCRMVLLPRFDAEQCIKAIAHHGCTFLPAVPTMLQKIIDHPAANRAALRSLRTVMTGGAPVPSALLRRLLKLAPDVEVLTGYGLTEGTALVTLTQVHLGQDGMIERERTIGRALDGMEITILDEDGAVQPTGECGEIAVRGPNVMAGYFEAPEDTAQAIRNGWLMTGDIGYFDADGYGYIVDRKKDVIIRGGQNIYPADIEDVLYQVPGVAEAAVVAREDTLLGEVPVAFVALKAGSAASIEDMLGLCRVSLAPYKCPVAIEILAELPKGPTGKILRRALRAQPNAEQASR